MAVIKKYNLSGDEIAQVSIEDACLREAANSQMIKDYIVAYRANQRQWSANTKGRSEVNHSKQKPHPQKGTGRARQGSLAAPQYKGGGRVFGPKPKFDQQVRLNKKEKRAVINTLLSQKIQTQHCHILSTEGLAVPRTKAITEFLKRLNLTDKKVLFLGSDIYKSIESKWDAIDEDDAVSLDATRIEEQYNQVIDLYVHRNTVMKSLRNVPKLSFGLLPNVNGYDLALHQDIVFLDGSVEQLTDMLGGNV